MYRFCFNIPQDPSRVLCGRDARYLLRKCDLNTANDGASAKTRQFYVLIILEKKRLSKLASGMANLSKFHVVFLLVFLYVLTRTSSKSTCAKPLIIVSQYSTGPQHNMGCKYKFECDLFVSFYWYIYTLGCRQLVVETDF